MEEIYKSDEDTRNYNRLMKKMNSAESEVDFIYAFDGLEVEL